MQPFSNCNIKQYSKRQTLLFSMLLGIYGLLFYFVFTYQFRFDFSSFYTSSHTVAAGDNPYQVLLTTYLPTVKKLAANLNPPIALWLLSPLSKLNYDTAMILWSLLSFVLGLIGAGIAFSYAFSAEFLKKNRLNLYLMYLSSFFTLMDTAIGQMGSLLLFFLMLGYHFYYKKQDVLAGIIWAVIIAIKLFPGLLFVYTLINKRYKISITMVLVLLCAWLIPLCVYGQIVYKQYYSMISHVLWYGDSWNASIYGFIFRVFVDVQDKTQSLGFVKLLYLILFSASFVAYVHLVNKNKQNNVNHQGFCLTLCMMLLMSPFGWLYYFPVLIFPLALTWLAASQEAQATKAIFIWLLGLFLLNFPMDYIASRNMHSLAGKLTVYSFHFYGLLLMTYLTSKIHLAQANADRKITINYYLLSVLYIIFSFIIIVLIISFVKRLIAQ